MTEETEARVPYDDLARIAFACKKCGAEVTVDLSDERQWKLESRAMECPVCGRLTIVLYNRRLWRSSTGATQ